LICAQEAHWQLGLDRLLVVPTGEAPHKEIVQDPGREVRFELCRIAFGDDERFELSRAEVDRDGPSYTVDTLRELRVSGGEDELFFILGGDEARSLASWHQPGEVLALATLAVAERDEDRREVVTAAISSLSGSERVTFFSMPRIAISSSGVRERVAAGRPIRYLVPAGVADHIESAGLYRQGVAA
jgi:nicotinate-nucleotide adenylyltransferase